MKVLLLEDELDLSAVACDQIENCGHSVIPAYSIAEAKAILAKEGAKIDLLIADQQMPDGNGAHFAIEAMAATADIRVVVVSGRLTEADMEALAAESVDYYQKPLLYSDVVQDIVAKYFA